MVEDFNTYLNPLSAEFIKTLAESGFAGSCQPLAFRYQTKDPMRRAGLDSLQFANTYSILHFYEKQGFDKFYPADITLYTSPVGIVDRRGRHQILQSTFAKSLHFANISGCSTLSLSLRKLP